MKKYIIVPLSLLFLFFIPQGVEALSLQNIQMCSTQPSIGGNCQQSTVFDPGQPIYLYFEVHDLPRDCVVFTQNAYIDGTLVNTWDPPPDCGYAWYWYWWTFYINSPRQHEIHVNVNERQSGQWAYMAPQYLTITGESCGNNVCEGGETCASCPQDCGICDPVCGNGICEEGENQLSCPEDCGCPDTFVFDSGLRYNLVGDTLFQTPFHTCEYSYNPDRGTNNLIVTIQQYCEINPSHGICQGDVPFVNVIIITFQIIIAGLFITGSVAGLFLLVRRLT